MALSPLTISVTSGVQGRSFKSAVSGFAAGNVVEVLPGGSWGFGYSNGFLTHNGLPADTNLAILRERNPVTGENLTTNLIITAASAYAVAQKASALDATYLTYRIAPVTQGDGSQIWNVFTDGQTGGTLNTPVNGPTVISISGTPPAATVGITYTFTPTTANGSGTKTFSYTGTVLSGFGLSFSTSTGAITGTPTANGTITGSIGVTDSSGTATPLPISIAVAAAPITLSALTLSPLTASIGAAYSGTISAATTGSTITATSSDGTTMTVSGSGTTRTLAGTFSGAGTPTITMTETLAGATNSPNNSTASVTVSSAITLAALSLSGSLQNGTATSGTITGATAGSTIVCNIPGITVNSGARTYSGTPTAMGTYANGLVETLAGATNSPKSNSFTVAAAALPLTGSLIARWSSSDLPVVADNTAVASWTDSISGFVVSQATAGLRPLYRTNRISGKPTVQSTGTQSLWMAHATNALFNAFENTNTVGFTIMIVYKLNGTTTYGAIVGCSDGTHGPIVGANGVRAGYGNLNNNNAIAVPYTTTGQFMTTGMVSSPLNRIIATGCARGFARGTCYMTVSGPLASALGTYGFGIFSRDDTGALMANAEVAEVLVWNTDFSVSDGIQFEAWACDLYGQSYPWASIPTGYFTVLDGDSILVGYGSDAPAFAPGYLTAQSLGVGLGQWTNSSIPGIAPPQMTTNATAGVDRIPALVGQPCKMFTWEYRNQKGSSLATQTANQQAYLSGRKAVGYKIAFGSSTTYASDTAGSPEANRAAYNAYWDVPANRVGYMDTYVPFHDVGFSSNANLIGIAGASPAVPPGTYFLDSIGHLTGKAGFPGVQSGYPVLTQYVVNALGAM